MGKIVLYVAQSLDGYIARENGAVDWLELEDSEDYGFHDFFQQVDVVLMGNTTYKQVLSFDIEFPYKGKEVYVFTKNKTLGKDTNVTYVSENIPEFVRNLKKTENALIWLVGGAKILDSFLENDLIDEFQLFTMPVLLGSGIKLFIKPKELKMDIIKTNPFKNGVLETIYNIKNE